MCRCQRHVLHQRLLLAFPLRFSLQQTSRRRNDFSVLKKFYRAIVDVPTDHPSCSKQHAVLQCVPCPSYRYRFPLLNTSGCRYRLHVTETVANGLVETVRPYLIDLETTNGLFPPFFPARAKSIALLSSLACRHVPQVRRRMAAHRRSSLLRNEGR